MTRQEAENKFKLRLDNEYLKLFENGELFVPGKELEWENLNNVFKIKILSYDKEELKVTFLVYEDAAEKKVSKHTFTLDNFFIYNRDHLAALYEISKEYDSKIHTTNDYITIDCSCIYIIKDKDNPKYYVGQAEHGSWRLLDHFNNAKRYIFKSEDSADEKEKQRNIQKIDLLIAKGLEYTLRFVPLEGSGYSDLDALEAAFIAFFNSYHQGYNCTRGNNGPGHKKITTNLSD
ncbi:MAG: GIY-YIG nuclease family protein [Ruminococcus sp.]|nr:GIY-YIG nuclease family protein [Ruminococcus sp.]